MVFNKVDKLINSEEQHIIHNLILQYPDSVFISALKGINLKKLEEKLISVINEELNTGEVQIPNDYPDAYKLINRLHKQVEILETRYLSRVIKLTIRTHKNFIEKINKMIKNGYRNERRNKLNRKELA
jgi:GTP-binding protein HflX